MEDRMRESREELLPLEKEVDEKPLERYADPVALAVAASGAIAAVVGALLLPVMATAFGEPARKPASPPFEYIEARLLKQGEVKDPTRLPDRIVPALPTAPDEILPLDVDEDKAADTDPDKKEKQPDAVTDEKLREVFDKARAFAEIQDDYVPEGDPGGVPDGDVTDPALASIGNTYAHKLMRIFADRLVYPTLLSDAELKRLRAKVHFRVDVDMVIIEVEFLQKSGNAMFDDAVQSAIDKVRAEVRELPQPPEAIAPTIFGGGINLTFNGADSLEP
jgi:outer membrane biosynthesis protein TonB